MVQSQGSRQYRRCHSNLDTLPRDQFPLLARLFANLVRFGLTACDSGNAGRLKGIYRRAWVRTQQQIADALLSQLTATDVPATLNGGAEDIME